MAIPRRVNSQPATLPINLGQLPAVRPEILADLPHVGEEGARPRSATLATASPEPTPVSRHPAFAELQRSVGLQQQAPHAEPEVHRFVDRAHPGTGRLRTPQEHDYEKPQPVSQSSAPQSSAPQTSVPQASTLPSSVSRQQAPAAGGWRAIFSHLPNVLAPMSGLIVTLALLTSAGLLFWMISRGQPAPLDSADFDAESGGYGVQVSELTAPEPMMPKVQPLAPADPVENAAIATQEEPSLEPMTAPSGEAQDPPTTTSAHFSSPGGPYYGVL